MPSSHRNLTLSRAPVNVWAQPGWEASLSTVDRERLLSVACGALLAMYGIRRGGWLGRTLAAAGAGLVTRAVVGHHDLTRARTWVARALDDWGWTPRAADRVQDESDASFPASDAPSWTPTAGATTRNERAHAGEGRRWQ